MKRLAKPTAWAKALAQAKTHSDSGWLLRYLSAEIPDDSQLAQALTYVREAEDFAVLIAALKHCETPAQRAEALGLVMDIISEQNPLFLELIKSLREGERNLILGALLETYQLDPDPERRLLKLKRLLEGMPQAGRSLYWPEAQMLAEQGGDDAQLMLLGLARQLPSRVLPATGKSLRQSVRKVKDAFKRTMAFVALAEMIRLTEQDLSEAKRSAELIPDASLREMALARLTSL
ncbi:MAG: hypothetical protein KC422_22630 [Trueperaceae bacterium]|nr:hypothetical protein [Trueperaceae bacterium]